MKMRKVISLLLVIGLILSLAACGGDDQVEALAEAYNRVAPMYNEIYDKAEANGWMADPQTEAEINALSATLGPLGESLSGDRSARAHQLREQRLNSHPHSSRRAYRSSRTAAKYRITAIRRVM